MKTLGVIYTMDIFESGHVFIQINGYNNHRIAGHMGQFKHNYLFQLNCETSSMGFEPMILRLRGRHLIHQAIVPAFVQTQSEGRLVVSLSKKLYINCSILVCSRNRLESVSRNRLESVSRNRLESVFFYKLIAFYSIDLKLILYKLN